jgi:S-adenosylmethionine hydrolase
MITLTSDFGLSDPYVAEMKGVILSINPKANIIDVTHGVEKFNIRMGAFMLASAAQYFPMGTVHLAVVDPGVGTERRGIIIQTDFAFYVGPDNGLLLLAAKNQGIKHVYQLANPKCMLPNISSTFHGRDVFAPAATYLDMGIEISAFGPEIFDPVSPGFSQVTQKRGILRGEVLHVDGFGNVITNIPQNEVIQAKKLKVNLQNQFTELPFAKTYAQAKPNQPIALVGSHGFLEIALNQGSAAQLFHAKSGDKIEVNRV